jgi:hypothetical protein
LFRVYEVGVRVAERVLGRGIVEEGTKVFVEDQEDDCSSWKVIFEQDIL